MIIRNKKRTPLLQSQVISKTVKSSQSNFKGPTPHKFPILYLSVKIFGVFSCSILGVTCTSVCQDLGMTNTNRDTNSEYLLVFKNTLMLLLHQEVAHNEGEIKLLLTLLFKKFTNTWQVFCSSKVPDKTVAIGVMIATVYEL